MGRFQHILLIMSTLTAVNPLTAIAQTPGEGGDKSPTRIEWLSKEYNFGAFREADGPVTGSVRFVNKGDAPTYINRVRPSCGCTGASYTTSMIEPGDTATVTFTYNPLGRPGGFDKTVRVYVGEDNDLTSIRITGTVLGSEATISTNYPVEIGDLRLENTLIAAGELKRGSARHLFLNIYNQGDRTISPTWIENSEALQVDLAPESISPGEVGTFSFYIRTVDEKHNGPFDYPVEIRADKNSKESVKVTVTGSIVPDSRALPLETLDKAPQAFLLPEYIDFGQVDRKRDLSFEFTILNDGKTDLKVDRVYSRDKEVIIKRVPQKVKPGKSAAVKGVVRASGLSDGPFRLKVEVITDDPLHPVRTCSLVGIAN